VMFNPHQLMCQKCERLRQNCDMLPFEDMKQIKIYAGVSVIVKCDRFKKRDDYE